MKILRNSFSVLLAALVLYSATGHLMVQHYCFAAVDVQESETLSCCNPSDGEDCCASPEQVSVSCISDTDECCFVSADYLINPFSVQIPAKFSPKTNHDFYSALLIALPFSISLSSDFNAIIAESFSPIPPLISDRNTLYKIFRI